MGSFLFALCLQHVAEDVLLGLQNPILKWKQSELNKAPPALRVKICSLLGPEYELITSLRLLNNLCCLFNTFKIGAIFIHC